jgi:membrane-associated HD superfamily phosphohydrolase
MDEEELVKAPEVAQAEGENTQAAEQATPSYKEKMLGRIRSSKPDYNPADEEDMLKEIDEIYSSAEQTANEYKGISEAFMDITKKDPRFAAVFEIMNDPKNNRSFGYAFAKVFGKDFLSASDEDIEKGDEEYKARVGAMNEAREKSSKNFEGYIASLDNVCKKYNLDEDQKSNVHNGIMEDLENYLTGSIPEKVVEDKVKALNYDNDMESAVKSGFAEGSTAKIKKEKKSLKTEMPDMASNTGSGVAPKYGQRTSPLQRFKENM